MAKTNRKTFTLQQGCSVYHENHHFIVLQILNSDNNRNTHVMG